MTTNDSIAGAINELNRSVGQLEAKVDSGNASIVKLFDKVDELSINGCAIGRKHGSEIKALQGMTRKTHGAAAGIGSGITLGVGTVVWGVIKGVETWLAHKGVSP